MNIGSFINNLDILPATEFIDKTGSFTAKKPKDFRTKDIIRAAHTALGNITASQASQLQIAIEKYQKRVFQSISKKWGCFLFLRDLFAAIGSLFGAKTIQQQFASLLKAIDTAKGQPPAIQIPPTGYRDSFASPNVTPKKTKPPTNSAPPTSPKEASKPSSSTASTPAAVATSPTSAVSIGKPPSPTAAPVVSPKKEPSAPATIATVRSIPFEPMTAENACALISFYLSPTFRGGDFDGKRFLNTLMETNYSKAPKNDGTVSDYDNFRIRLHNHRLMGSLENGVDLDNKDLKDLHRYPEFTEQDLISLGRTLEECLKMIPCSKTITTLSTGHYYVTSIPKHFSVLFPSVITLSIYSKMGAKIELTSSTITRLTIHGDCHAKAPVLDLSELTHLTLTKHVHSLNPNLDRCPKLKHLTVDSVITSLAPKTAG